MRIRRYEPDWLAAGGPNPLSTPDPDLVRTVRKAVERLAEPWRAIIEERYFEGLTFPQIARRHKMSMTAVAAAYYEATRQLREQLAAFAAKRWNLKVGGLCRVCRHKDRDVIESMLTRKSPDETWSAFGNRLYQAIGERIGPPIVLICHQKHMKGMKDE